MRAFVGNDYPTVGVEQEFHLVDSVTGELVPCVDQVLDNIDVRMRESLCYELFHSVLEYKSAVCRTIDELRDDVIKARRKLARACEKVGVRLVAAGSHPFSDWHRQKVINNEHYQWVAHECMYSAWRMIAFGLHVHVGMQNVESAMYAMYEMRRWVYPLLALSANSPYFEGRVTGMASTRTILFGCMPRTLMPPEFENFAELESYYEQLLATGDVEAPGDLWWSIRPQPPLGTVELRVLDLPTDVRRLAALGAITQATLAIYQDRFNAGTEPSRLNPAYIQQNRWKAIRHGLDGKIIDPLTGEILEMREQIAGLLDMVNPKAKELGSLSHINFAREMLEKGTESEWQVKKCEELGGNLHALELEIAKRTIL